MGTIIERIKEYLETPRVLTKDVVEAAMLLNEVLETMYIKPNNLRSGGE